MNMCHLCIRFKQKISRGSHSFGSRDMSTLSEFCEFYKQHFPYGFDLQKVQK